MATQSASDLKDELMNCSICLQKLTQPKTLRCLHTFCQGCLEGCLNALLNRIKNDGVTRRRIKLPCPTCREETPLPEQGISGLKSDFKVSKIADLINVIGGKIKQKAIMCHFCKTARRRTAARYNCKDCAKNFCKQCMVIHQQTFSFTTYSVKDLKKSKVILTSPGEVCKVHKGELLRYYCQHCHKKLCCMCAMLKSSKHKLISLEDVKKAQRTKMIKEKKQYTKIWKQALMKQKLDALETSLRESYDDTSAMKQSGMHCKKLHKIRKQLRKSYLLIRNVQGS